MQKVLNSCFRINATILARICNCCPDFLTKQGNLLSKTKPNAAIAFCGEHLLVWECLDGACVGWTWYNSRHGSSQPCQSTSNCIWLTERDCMLPSSCCSLNVMVSVRVCVCVQVVQPERPFTKPSALEPSSFKLKLCTEPPKR
eukprot:6273712-Amphidinium_carterae.1